MKTISKLFLFSIVILALLVPSGQALAAGTPDEVVTGSWTLESGETLNDDLTVLGGTAIVEEGATVNGDVKVIGGSLTIAGKVRGDIAIIGGNVELEESAHVTGDVQRLGGALWQDEGATIDGRIRGPGWERGDWGKNYESWSMMPGYYYSTSPWDNPLGGLLTFLLRAFVISALAVVVTIFWPRQAQVVGETAIGQPLLAGGLGLLTVLVVPVLVIALILTIIGLVAVPFVLMLLAVMVMFGWIGIGIEIGRRLAQALRADWALPLTAGLGTLLLTFVTDGAAWLVSCPGAVLPALVGLISLGAVLLTRFGTQPYQRSGAFVPYSPAPAAGPTTVIAEDVTVINEGGAGVYPAPEGPTEPPVIFPDEQN